MDDATQICPECDSEYLPHASTCSDCGVPLVQKSAVQDAKTPLPYSDRLVEVQTETLPWIKTLADRLAKAGIRSHIRLDRVTKEPPIDRSQYYHTLYVRPRDAEAAKHIDRELLGHGDLDHGSDASGEAASTAEGTCPACGSAFTDANDNCADCGLHLGPPQG